MSMVKCGALIAILIFVHGICAYQTTPLALHHNDDSDMWVRVLLDTKDVHVMPIWNLYAPQGVCVAAEDPTFHLWYTLQTYLSISYDGSIFWLHDTPIPVKRLHVYPRGAHASLTYGDTPYAGSFVITVSEGTIYTVNIVDIESYVFSVLRWEGWPGWPNEVYKAFAIMCRTYVADKVGKERERSQRLYDIQASNAHQTYKGIHPYTRLQQAVDATRGLVLAYHGKPILAMYDACCGGVIPAYMEDVDFERAPYLARWYPCTFCSSYRIYRWQYTYTISQLYEVLSAYVSVPRFEHISIAYRDDAGVARSLYLHHDGSYTIVSADTLAAACKHLRSLCFATTRQMHAIMLHGYGFGHHLGLCQWGAREMVRHGWDHQRILHFYYPSVSCIALQDCIKE